MQVRSEIKRLTTLLSSEAQFRGWALSGQGRANDSRIRALRNGYAGRRCFVMGNGPSLLQCDLNSLGNEVTIVSNAHYLIWDQLTYIPTFLAVEDQLVVEDRCRELRLLSGITTVFPFEYAAVLGEPTRERLYVNFPRLYRPWPKFSGDIARRAYWGGTVSFLNLQLAAYLGCNPIILIGFDHNYAIADRINDMDSVIHSSRPDVNHIHPDYFGPGYRWHDPDVARMETSYRCARQALERSGIQVLNATVGGHLEVFDRVSFDEIS